MKHWRNGAGSRTDPVRLGTDPVRLRGVGSGSGVGWVVSVRGGYADEG